MAEKHNPIARAGLRYLTTILLAAAVTAPLSGCGGSGSSGGGSGSSGTESGTDGSGSGSTATGTAQKGPFQPGGSATLTRLADDGSLTGDAVQGDITENGDYTLSDITWSGQSLLSLSGSYFDETTGNFSGDSRELHAVVAAADGGVEANVNLYTHLAAARVRHLMGAGTAFADARSQAVTELQELVGIEAEPEQLNLLEAVNGVEGDSANLLLFSAALLAAGHGQAEIDAVTADFADNGQMDGSGATAWTDVQNAAADDPNLLDDARGNLQAQYGKTPPASNSGGFAWLLDACTAAARNEPRVLCEDASFTGDDLDDSGEFVTFVPLVTGHYTIELFDDPSVNDANTGACSWRLYKQADINSTEMGNSLHDGSFCGVEDSTTYRLNADTKYYIRPLVSQDDSNGPRARFRLSATRVSEGKEMASHAVELPLNEDIDAVAGELTNSTTRSYYRFTAGEGTHTITATGFPCGSGGALRLELYEGVSAMGFTDRIAYDWTDGKCSQSVESALEAGREYYLKVENRLGSWHTTSSRPAPGKVDFTLKISTD